MRIAFWSTSSLEPGYEAVSSEVFGLARRFPGSWIFAISSHYRLRFSRKERYAGLHSALDPVTRIVVRLLQHRFEVNHVYGDLTPWTFQKALTRPPIFHTVTQSTAKPGREFLERCDQVVVQTHATFRRLREAGVPAERLHLWLPGVDLDRFHPRDRPSPDPARPSLLFAAAPRRREELDARGVPLLIETAARNPDVAFRLLFRPWKTGYTSLDETRREIQRAAVRNVSLTDGIERMQDVYARFAFTVIPFLDGAGGKECPNSALESLACGTPVLVSSACPFAEFVAENRCGVTFDPDPGSLGDAVERGSRNWESLSRAARATAERFLDVRTLHSRYADLYSKAAPSR